MDKTQYASGNNTSMASAIRVVSETVASTISKGGAWGPLILVLGFTAWVRIRLLAIPFERDEGEFAYMGQLILQGIPPYLHAYTMKLPGTHAAYALVMGVLGQTVEAVHVGLILVNGATTLVLYCLIRRLFGDLAALGGAATFSLLSLSPSVLGTSAHATHFVLLPALGGLFLLVKSAVPFPTKTLLVSGFLLGVGVLMKQPGVFFVELAVFVVICSPRRNIWAGIRCSLVLVFGAVIPYAGTCFALWAQGAIERFWFWTLEYGWAYSSILPLSAGRRLLYSQASVAAGSGIWLWIIAAAGVIVLPLYAKRNQDRRFALAFLTFSFLAVCPGFYFRRHYWILLLPAIAMFVAVALGYATQMASNLTRRRLVLVLPFGLFIAACAATIHNHFDFFFRLTPSEACRALYGNNPFPEASEIGKYLQEHTTPEDTVAVIGSEPEIYFYSRRISATGHIYTYGMMEEQPYALRMQQEMAREIAASSPKYMVFVGLSLSWLASVESNRYIFSWFEGYKSSHYQTVRVLNLAASLADALPRCLRTDTANGAASSPCYIEILERSRP
jgi:hypothetical protein